MSTKHFQRIIGSVLGLGLSLLPAGAIPVNITMYNNSSVIAAPASALSSFGDSTVFSWLQSDVTAYNTASGTSYPVPTANPDGTPLSKVNTTSGGSSVTVTVPSQEYVFLHWGGQNGGWAQAFYNSGDALEYTFNAPPGGQPLVGGISFYSTYGPGGGSVPATGASVGLLGLVLAGLVLMRMN